MSQTWTLRSVLEWTASDFEKRGIDSPRLDADLLVARALQMERIALYLDLERPLDDTERGRVRQLVERRRRREPVAYILGEREFYGRPFEVNPHVLIPRPDTELLVEQALRALDAGPDGAVLDLCTGSGAVAVVVAAERPEQHVVATDISEQALEVARRNAERNGVAERVAFHSGDLFEALPDSEPFACITANPPYVREDERAELQPEVRDHEPELALFAADEGLGVIRRILQGAAERLVDGGSLLMEVGYQQAAQVAELFEQAGFRDVERVPDLSGIERVVRGVRGESPN